ncbi:MAG: GGDEF domain-containing protein [Candidatus Eremiobacteraeota bacterium]|nr:GGDEF domain-containing protein [Candidatus Eremiobacteraeota bacterium]
MLVWNADLSLRVTSLSARLRDLAGIGSGVPGLHVSDLWGNDDRLAIALAAHHWALEGESLAFEAPIGGTPYHCEVEPLQDPSGAVVGVAGRAIEVSDGANLDAQAMLHAERSAGMGTWFEDLRTGAVTMSEGLAMLLGTPRHVRSLDIRAFDHPDDRAMIAETIAEFGNADGYICDHRILCLGSRVRVVRERVRAVFDDRGVAIARVGTLIDITDLKEREAELAELALQDPLTRLPNRASLEERLASAIARCNRDERACAVLFLDIDGFKSINDERGHFFGDRALIAIAHRLARNVRASDMVARLGGDEFVILIDDLFTEEAGLDAARKLLHSLDDPFVINGEDVHVSASIGVAVYPHSGLNPQQLLEIADREMYAVKQNGGRGVKLANASSWLAGSSADHRPFAILESA